MAGVGMVSGQVERVDRRQGSRLESEVFGMNISRAE